MDRRIKKTEDAILQATIELLTTTSINDLTIKEICNAANVSRSTFYLHYIDAQDVVQQLYNDVAITLTNALDNFDFSHVLTNPRAFLLDIMSIVKKYLKQFELLVETNYHSDFRRRLKHILVSKILKDNSYRYKNTASFEYSVNFIMSGLVETICDNMQDVLDENKKNVLIDTLSTLISQGANIR